MVFESDSSIFLLIQQYSQLVFNKQFVSDFKEPLFDMPIPVLPHKRGDIILSGHSSIQKDEPLHCHNYFLINYAYRGDYREIIDGKEVLLREHDIYFSQPYVPHCLLSHESNEDILLSIRIRKNLLLHSLMPVLPKNEEFLNFCISPLNMRPSAKHRYLIFHEDPSLRQRIYHVFTAMIEEYVKMQPGYDTLLDTNLANLLALLSRCYILHRAEYECLDKTPTLVDRILHYISNNCATTTLTQVSEEFHYHPNYVSTLLQKETGQTFSEIIRNYRLDRARILLSNSDMPIEEIAVLVGYPHTSNFYRNFRKYCKVSPNQYRKDHKTVQLIR